MKPRLLPQLGPIQAILTLAGAAGMASVGAPGADARLDSSSMSPLVLLGIAVCIGLAIGYWTRAGRLSVTLAFCDGIRPLPQSLLGSASHFGAADMLRFRMAGPDNWIADRGAWRMDLAYDGSAVCPWRLTLLRVGHPDANPWPVASAGSLDALITVARRLLPSGGILSASDMLAGDIADLLDRDLELEAVAKDGVILALAEGGYAERMGDGSYIALSSEAAEARVRHAAPAQEQGS